MRQIANRIITRHRTPLLFGNDSLQKLGVFLHHLRPSSIFILVDQNTRQHCLPLLLDRCPSLSEARIVETNVGEAAKTLDSAISIWQELHLTGAERTALIINLGGGTVSDLGGFVAAAYKRGIPYINIPTTLMGQADASIGGKTGVNLGPVKNQVGFLYAASAVYIVPEFLKTLPYDQLRSGFAEIIKSALIGDARLWRKIESKQSHEIFTDPLNELFWTRMVFSAAKFKNSIVVRDYQERKLRKVLNFGHTIGHAFEGMSLNNLGCQVLHGDAVAAGMICAAWISNLKAGLPVEDLNRIVAKIDEFYPRLLLQESQVDQVIGLLRHDKKNMKGNFRFTLITRPGQPVCNVTVTPGEVAAALAFYTTI